MTVDHHRPADWCDVLITGGRVIDPETALDTIADVAITGDRIVAVGAECPRTARQTLDARGCVVAPGFIDLHSHAQTIPSLRAQALDGVTTALELEAGAGDVAGAIAAAADEGRPVHYGYSASWAETRMALLAEIPLGHGFVHSAPHLGNDQWGRPANRAEQDRLLAMLGEQLAAGALGIGVLAGYAPATGRDEFQAVSQLAADTGSATFTHARYKKPTAPHGVVDAIDELIGAAEDTGAHTHLCHLNSTSLRTVDTVTERIESARAQGLSLTTEAYPYGAGMTAVSAPFLHPDRLADVGVSPSQLTIARTGEPISNESQLRAVRRDTPGELVIIHYLDEASPADQLLLQRAVFFADTAIASDAIPFTDADGTVLTGEAPLPSEAMSHPRTAGTFARFLAMVRETGAITMLEAVRRCTLIPATILAELAPAMARKGRIQPGCDADLVVFDPAAVVDRATYLRPATTSTGFHHVLVAGTPVVHDQQLTDALPGQPVTGGTNA